MNEHNLYRVEVVLLNCFTKITKNSEPKPLSKGFSEENDRKNQAPMPNEDDMSECPTLSPFYRIRRAIQAQASASASA